MAPPSCGKFLGTRNVITGASYVNGALAVPSSKNVGDNGTTTKVPVLAPSHHQYPSAPWRDSHAIAVVEVHDILEQPTPPPRTAERSTEPKFIPETDSGCELPLGAKFTTPPRFVTTGAAQLRKPLVNRSGACIHTKRGHLRHTIKAEHPEGRPDSVNNSDTQPHARPFETQRRHHACNRRVRRPP